MKNHRIDGCNMECAQHAVISNGLCCCNFMHIRTGVQIIVYLELMSLTCQLSYLAARVVVDGFSIWIPGLFVFCMIQVALAVVLFNGTRNYQPRLLLVAMIGLGARLIMAIAVLLDTVREQWRTIESDENGHRRIPLLSRFLFLCCLIVLLIISVVIVYRCYVFMRQLEDASQGLIPVSTMTCCHQPMFINQLTGRSFIGMSNCQLKPTKKNVKVTNTDSYQLTIYEEPQSEN